MKRRISLLRARLHLVAAGILLVGLGSAGYLYFTADEASESVLLSEFENSKVYRHELEAYGGKVNVLASDLMRWFDGLWQGKSLACTVACSTILLSAAFFLVARHVAADDEPGDHGGQKPGGAE
ncbi:MAG TPA: hypothetical protein VIU40_04620 [Geobacteraceae bacterium]